MLLKQKYTNILSGAEKSFPTFFLFALLYDTHAVTIQYTMYIVHCTLYIVHYTLYIVQYTLYIVVKVSNI